MKLGGKFVALSLTAFALATAHAGDAEACGGCFVQQTENTQVSSHRMILSISPAATTLWDQIIYTGAPESFAWILPVVGLADIGLSSDALFETLDQMTTVQVFSPQINCTPPSCNNASGAPEADGAGSSGGGEDVTVVAQETVGPYETVQLASTNPNALRDWLLSHNYNIPLDVQPIIDGYVSEGFNFLALKLVPGQGIDAMRPVRITTAGASPELPLRMVAAGTGAVTPITLWLMGEGRYEPTNFTSFEIDQQDLIWFWDTQSSNYKDLRQKGFDEADGTSWLIEAGEPASSYGIRDTIMYLAEYDPTNSGYADENGEGAPQAAEEDLAALFSTIPDSSLWVTRMYGELSRLAFASDLEVGASLNQEIVNRYLQAENALGTPPACPPPPPGCDEIGDSPDGIGPFWGAGSSPGLRPGSCAMEGRAGNSFALGGAVAFAALALARRRRSRR